MNYEQLRNDFKKTLYETFNCIIIFYEVNDPTLNTLYKRIESNNYDNNVKTHIKNLYNSINNLHIFSNNHTIDDLINIDNNISREEHYKHKPWTEYSMTEANKINNLFTSFCIKIIRNIDAIKIKLLNNPFYGNTSYKLTESEILYSIIFSFYFPISYAKRELFGYNMKMILPTYEYNLIKNLLNIFNDYEDGDRSYNRFIKKAFGEFIVPFSNGETEIIDNPHYSTFYDNHDVSQYEKHYESKYEEIIKLI